LQNNECIILLHRLLGVTTASNSCHQFMWHSIPSGIGGYWN